MFDWNDLRYFLAVADAGSTLKAAQAMRTNQTTVARRITALETALGQKLFERRTSGFSLSEAGEALLDKARAVAAATAAIDVDAARSARDVSGTVRVTANEIFCEIILPPMLMKLRERYPHIRIELEHSQEKLDLGRGEADVAIRYSLGVGDNGLIRRKLYEDGFTPVCGRSYAERNGTPRSKSGLLDHPYIGGGGSYYWPTMKSWLDANVPGLEPAMTVDTMTTMFSAVRAGLGIAVLNEYVYANEPDLVQCWSSLERWPVWILIHERSRDMPHVRTVMTELGDMIVAEARQRGLS